MHVQNVHVTHGTCMYDALMSKPCIKSTVTMTESGAANRGAATQESRHMMGHSLRRMNRLLWIAG